MVRGLVAGRRRLGCAWPVVVLLVSGAPAAAGQVSPDSIDINIPYAHYYGTGVYWVGEQRVYILGLRGRVQVHDFGPQRIGVAIRAAGTMVWQQVARGDSSWMTYPLITLTPGIELAVPIGSRALLRPFADAGIARHVEAAQWLGLGAFGMGLEWVFPWKRMEIGVEPRAAYGRSFASDPLFDDEILAAILQMDLRHPVPLRIAGAASDVGPYVLVARFWGDLDLDPTSRVADVDRHVELGVSFGTNPSPKVWLFRLPRVRVGYRFGPNFRGLRIGFSDRRLRLPPR